MKFLRIENPFKFYPNPEDENMSEILQYFEYKHLPEKLQEISKPICKLANKMDQDLIGCPETSAGLRKLLEAKDCFVRAALLTP